MVDSLVATLGSAMFRPNDQLQPVPWLLHSETSVSAAELSCCKGADACVKVPTRRAADSVTGLYKRKKISNDVGGDFCNIAQSSESNNQQKP